VADAKLGLRCSPCPLLVLFPTLCMDRQQPLAGVCGRARMGVSSHVILGSCVCWVGALCWPGLTCMCACACLYRPCCSEHGTIVHTGDWKIDENPVDGEAFDRTTFDLLSE
jgi:hypothetical protein